MRFRVRVRARARVRSTPTRPEPGSENMRATQRHENGLADASGDERSDREANSHDRQQGRGEKEREIGKLREGRGGEAAASSPVRQRVHRRGPPMTATTLGTMLRACDYEREAERRD